MQAFCSGTHDNNHSVWVKNTLLVFSTGLAVVFFQHRGVPRPSWLDRKISFSLGMHALRGSVEIVLLRSDPIGFVHMKFRGYSIVTNL